MKVDSLLEVTLNDQNRDLQFLIKINEVLVNFNEGEATNNFESIINFFEIHFPQKSETNKYFILFRQKDKTTLHSKYSIFNGRNEIEIHETDGFIHQLSFDTNYISQKFPSSWIDTGSLFKDRIQNFKEPYYITSIGVNSGLETQLNWILYSEISDNEQFGDLWCRAIKSILLGFLFKWQQEKNLLEIKNLYESLSKKNQELIDSDKRSAANSKMAALGEMAGGIAHEINNPLTIIIGKTDLLFNKIEKDLIVDKKALLKSVETINQTAKRIAAIVKGLRSFSRLGDNDPMTLCELKNVIEDTISLCHEKMKNKKIKLIIENKDNIAGKFWGRSFQIGQVLLNLLNNSIDALEGITNPEIKIHICENDKFSILQISDNGTGIPLDIREKIMLPFFTTKDPGKGTGLGLSISQSIITEHRGIFEILPQKETTFSVSLPKLKPKSIL